MSLPSSFDGLSDDEAKEFANASHRVIRDLMRRAARIRDGYWGKQLTYSPKAFLPVTNLCGNRCKYCAFRRSPGDAGEHTMSPEDIDAALFEARSLGCYEALVCLGDRPERSFRSYRRTLAGFGHQRTVDYLMRVCGRAVELGLLPHTNAGILPSSDMLRLRTVNASLGLMLETTSARLGSRGMAHHGAPDKRPELRLAVLEAAGKLRIPFTTGILVGIGETRRERIEALLAIRAAHLRYRHVQEVIVQNFTPHVGTPWACAQPPSNDEMAHAVAMARLILPDEISVQAPPNLNECRNLLLVESGLNDFGGISPVTPDFINPDRPWPQLEALSKSMLDAGYELVPRLCIYDRFAERPEFVDPAMREPVARAKEKLARGTFPWAIPSRTEPGSLSGARGQ